MIPKNIEREYILKALEESDRLGVPPERYSDKYYLEYSGKTYLTNILSLANIYANNKEFDPSVGCMFQSIE